MVPVAITERYVRVDGMTIDKQLQHHTELAIRKISTFLVNLIEMSNSYFSVGTAEQDILYRYLEHSAVKQGKRISRSVWTE